MESANRVKPEKKPYITPKLTVHGDIREVTQGASTGAFTDATFSGRTPVDDLTFSN